jgi:hypothetical protein
MIAYYAHSHGSGHAKCAENLSISTPEQFVILTDSDYKFHKNLHVVRLENEHVDGSELYYNRDDQPHYVHYSPIGLKKIIRRSRTIIDTVLKNNVQLMIVDVSVEVAALARASSIPYAYRRLSGNRNDVAHLEAYRGALFLIAYYPESFEDCETLEWVKAKTLYLGFTQPLCKRLLPVDSVSYDYTIIQGFGGAKQTDWILKMLVELKPNSQIVVVGPIKNRIKDTRITYTGAVANIQSFITNAKTIIASCGSNLSKEIMDKGKRFLAIPEERPYREQHIYARTLERNGLAIELTQENFSFAIEAAKSFDHFTVPSNLYCDASSAYQKIVARLNLQKNQYNATA